MSAGRGIWHSEKNWSPTDEVHFIQMWVVPDTFGIDPGYEQLDVNDALDSGGLVEVASGRGTAAPTANPQNLLRRISRFSRCSNSNRPNTFMPSKTWRGLSPSLVTRKRQYSNVCPNGTK